MKGMAKRHSFLFADKVPVSQSPYQIAQRCRSLLPSSGRKGDRSAVDRARGFNK